MAVIGFREIIPRTLSHRFGESPTAERKYTVTVDEPTSSAVVIGTVGILHGDPHPEYPFLRMLDASMVEADRQHVEITYRYELPNQENLDANPLARPDVWSFTTSGAQVPFLSYYDGSGNTSIKPLVNAAGDFIEGMTVLAPEVRASISGNRSVFPMALAAEVTNAINSSPYLNGDAYTWQCNGISGQQASEVINGVEVRYWQITVELTYRKGGYIEKVPHVGWHYIDGGKKRRVWAWNESGDEKIDASAPQPLTSTGALKYPGAEGEPDQLLRRPYPVADFASYFGTPTF